ncbi:MAG: hypothetical protein ACJ75R_04325 [Solirubrobacterales bacterium]
MNVQRITGGPLGTAVAERLQGKQPARLRAFAAATMAGGATAVVVYRILRSADEDSSE